MDTAPALCASETVSANVRMVLRGLLAALGAWGVEPVLALLLYRRVSITIGRIERMLARFRAGRLWRVTQRNAGQRGLVCPNAGVRLPRGFGWLVKLGGYQAAGFGSQLQTVLNTPEMAELLTTSAQARRILRPVCRALAVELPGLSGAAPVEIDQRRERKCRPRAQPEPFRVPLPRGVLTAARRQGFGKDR